MAGIDWHYIAGLLYVVIFRLILFLVLASIAGYFIDWHETHFTGISFGWFGVILVLTLIHFLAEPLRWQVYLGGGIIKRCVSFFHIFSCTAFLSYVLPAKLGLPLRYWLIVRQQNLQASTVGLFMAIDGALGLLLWAVSSLVLGWGLVYSMAVKYIPIRDTDSWIVFIVAGLLSLGLAWFSGRKRWGSWRSKLEIGLSQVRLMQLAQATFLFVLDIGGYIARHAAILAALSAPFIGWQEIASVTVLSIFSGFLCMLPMGLVGYDAVIVLLLRQYGISVEIAVMVPLINRSSNLLLSAILGVPSVLKLGLATSSKSVAKMIDESRHA